MAYSAISPTQGKAYGFFDCEASKEGLKAELPDILDYIQAPSQLEVSLMDMGELMKKSQDPNLLRFILGSDEIRDYIFPSTCKDREAKPYRLADLKFILEANWPGASNQETAERVGDIVNRVYSTYNKNKPFKVAVICEIDGEFLFMR